ncbi:hypothetical protein GCM10027589_35940 [Actinocorallia lasiicapitis]
MDFDGGRRDPWGWNEPPAGGRLEPLPERLAELAELRGQLPVGPGVDWPGPGDLPEVAALVDEGWTVLEYASTLPAVWPPEHRCWVPDRLPRVEADYSDPDDFESPMIIRPWTIDEHADHRGEEVDLARQDRLPAPPPGRIWLLRSPWPSLEYAAVTHLIDEWEQEHPEFEVTRRFHTARHLLALTEEEIWSRWTDAPPAVHAWRAAGRPVGELALLNLTPADIENAGLTEPQVLAWQHSIDITGPSDLSQIHLWTDLGATPPPR